ncbi:hypothetical protein [Neptunicella marina]|uniref:Uncharacterized protein n=1 Tax=Neptunicella marina TaxID=2125989 RepID=A0A8J6M3H3_9ALTE|nr:hypothetical protein [Neptunicella marina]MBC3767468.1 hypothetical protein [Neptunicella marina]
MIKHLLFLSLIFSSPSYAEVLSEKSKDVGYGFREVSQHVKMPKEHWEGIGHFNFLYFKDVLISQTSDYLISTDGTFVIFTNGPTGSVQVYYPSLRKTDTLEQYVKEKGIPTSFEELEIGKILAVYTSGQKQVFNVAPKP